MSIALLALYPTPWRVGTEQHHCGFQRYSTAIEDANGCPVVMLDPSEGEYADGCNPDVAAMIVAFVNSHHGGTP